MPCPSTLQLVEPIVDGDETLAIVVRNEYAPERTTFLTAPEHKQQLGFVVYPAGSEIPRHCHTPIVREIHGSSECLLVRRGKSELTLYNSRHEEVCRRLLSAGDVVLLMSGGHGFRQIEDAVFLEIKQGSYPGVVEKEAF